MSYDANSVFDENVLLRNPVYPSLCIYDLCIVTCLMWPNAV